MTKMRDVKLSPGITSINEYFKAGILTYDFYHNDSHILNDNLYMKDNGKDVGVIHIKNFEILGEKRDKIDDYVEIKIWKSCLSQYLMKTLWYSK